MIIVEYNLKNGISLDNACVILKTVILNSHTVTLKNADGEEVTSEQKDISCSFFVDASSRAYESGKPYVEVIESVYPYDESKDIEAQAYENFKNDAHLAIVTD